MRISMEARRVPGDNVNQLGCEEFLNQVLSGMGLFAVVTDGKVVGNESKALLTCDLKPKESP